MLRGELIVYKWLQPPFVCLFVNILKHLLWNHNVNQISYGDSLGWREDSYLNDLKMHLSPTPVA